jgi:hypothetical protein
MCTVLLPPGVNPIAVNKYIISYQKDRLKYCRYRCVDCDYIQSRECQSDTISVHQRITVFVCRDISEIFRPIFDHNQANHYKESNNSLYILYKCLMHLNAALFSESLYECFP